LTVSPRSRKYEAATGKQLHMARIWSLAEAIKDTAKDEAA
jgi:hypothetical protein